MSSILSIPNLQIWDNAAFDDSQSHLPLQSISLNLNINHDPIKENVTPLSSPSSSKKKPINIDAEIADIETQINRLSKKLESLKIKKAQIEICASKTPASSKRGRIVPAKFLNLDTPSTKTQESRRRGLSLGPAEIYQNATPFSARKPCFQKLEGIKEEKSKEKTARRRGMSLGPSEIAMSCRVSELRKGVATVGAKKPVKMDQGSILGIKPKTLFEEKKRPLKNAAKVRIVASRYSLASSTNEEGNKRRKWSLPEAEKEEEEKNVGVKKSKKRSLSLGGGNLRRSSPSSIMKIAEGLPKIKTLRHVIESPRDSGCAKRFAELVGRKSCFAEDGARSSCQSLNFEDGEDQ